MGMAAGRRKSSGWPFESTSFLGRGTNNRYYTLHYYIITLNCGLSINTVQLYFNVSILEFV